MRISQIILSKKFGGAERHFVDLCNSLSQRHELQAVIRRPRDFGPPDPLAANFRAALGQRIQVKEVGPILRNCGIGRAVREFQPQVIHTHLGDAGKALCAIRPHIPLVATLHGQFKEKCYRMHNALICVADWQRRTIPPTFNGRIVTIPNFVRKPPKISDDESASLRYRLGIGANHFIVGAVGRLSREKGFDTLVLAFNLCKLHDATLVIVGDGPERRALENLASTNVVFVGWQADPWPFYALFDVVVVPSRSEAFGLTILEAMQAGVPVISTSSEGPREILADGTGILVNIEDPDQMAVEIRSMANSPGKRGSFSDLGRIKAATYNTDQIVPRIEALYSELAGKSAS